MINNLQNELDNLYGVLIEKSTSSRSFFKKAKKIKNTNKELSKFFKIKYATDIIFHNDFTNGKSINMELSLIRACEKYIIDYKERKNYGKRILFNTEGKHR